MGDDEVGKMAYIQAAPHNMPGIVNLHNSPLLAGKLLGATL